MLGMLVRRRHMPQSKVAPQYVKRACSWCRGEVLRGYKHREGFQKCLQCHRTSWWSWQAQFPELDKGEQGKLW